MAAHGARLAVSRTIRAGPVIAFLQDMIGIILIAAWVLLLAAYAIKLTRSTFDSATDRGDRGFVKPR
jgi:hypothetical protein